MPRRDGGTSPTLLRRGGDWRDHVAWGEIVERYEPLLWLVCGDLGLDVEATEEVIQRVWIDLARRLPTFQYDPGRTFRGWLRSLCRSRALDLIRKQGLRGEIPLEDVPEAIDRWEADPVGPNDVEDEPSGERRPLLLKFAVEAQRAVRARVDPETWRAFWLVVVEGRGVKEAADLLGKNPAAVFAAQKRVKQRLRDEGERLLSESEGASGFPRP